MRLPPRPYTVRVTVILRTVLLTFLCLALGGLSLFIWPVVQKDVAALRKQDAIWKSGAVALETHVNGHENTSHFMEHAYHLRVEYTDQNGKVHHRELERSVFGETMDIVGSQIVHYQVDAPDEFALSSAVEVADGSWWSICVVGAGGALLLFSACYLPFIAIRNLTDILHCAKRSEVIDLPIIKREKVQNHGISAGEVFHCKGVSVEGRVVTGSLRVGRSKRPMYGSGQSIVGLVSPFAPRRAVLLRDDFYPYHEPPPADFPSAFS